MLTTKGAGGGVARVTNGRLREMYAVEGEIPAGTFVGVKDMLGKTESNENFSVFGGGACGGPIRCVTVRGMDFLFTLSDDSSMNTGKKLTVTIKCKKRAGNTFVDLPDMSVSGTRTTTHNDEFDTNYPFSNYFASPIVIGGNKVLFADKCVYYTSSSGTRGLHLMYFFIEVSGDGSLRCTPLTFLRLTTSTYPVMGATILMRELDGSTISCVWSHYAGSYGASGMVNVSYSVHAWGLSLTSGLTLSEVSSRKVTVMSKTLGSVGFSEYSPYFELTDSICIQGCLVLKYCMNASSSGTEYLAAAVDTLGATWTTLEITGSANALTGDTASVVTRTMHVVDGHLVVFSKSDNGSLAADLLSVQKKSGGLSVTSLSFLPGLQNDNPLGEVRLGYPCALGENVFMIDSYAASAPYAHAFKLLRLNDGQLSEATGWFDAPDALPEKSSNFEFFQATDDRVIVFAGTCAYICGLGTFQLHAFLPTGSIDGLTKTKCTETKKGAVWLLDANAEKVE